MGVKRVTPREGPALTGEKSAPVQVPLKGPAQLKPLAPASDDKPTEPEKENIQDEAAFILAGKRKRSFPEHLRPYLFSTKNQPQKKAGRINLTAKLREILALPMDEGSKYTNADFLMAVLYERANKGDIRSMEMIFNRVEGKVPDKVHVTNETLLDKLTDEEMQEILDSGKPKVIEEPEDGGPDNTEGGEAGDDPQETAE